MSCLGTAVRYDESGLALLDQTALPQAVVWLPIQTAEEMIQAIQRLAVRGAPLIGVASVLLLADLIRQNKSDAVVMQAAKAIRAARPTAVNLMHAIDAFIRVFQGEAGRTLAEEWAIRYFHEDVALCERLGQQGATLVQQGDALMTVCNTGGLATAGSGTAFSVFKTAHADDKAIHVYVTETRPLLQGGRLTTWECEQNRIPYTLITDNMAASVMQRERIAGVFVGADRITANGDFANKIGTYSLAVLAQYHDIPFYVVAPYTTFDANTKNGSGITIEMRAADEVRGVSLVKKSLQWAPEKSPVINPAFDVTPHALVAAYVFDQGIFKPHELHKVRQFALPTQA